MPCLRAHSAPPWAPIPVTGSMARRSAWRPEKAVAARRQADKLACAAWTKRMLDFARLAQRSPTLGDALNAGYGYLEVRCPGCDTHQTVALDIVRRPKTTPIHEVEKWNATCDARTARRCAAIHTSAVIGSRCGRSKISAKKIMAKRIGGDDLQVLCAAVFIRAAT